MNDTAIPLPADAEARFAALTDAWRPLFDELACGLEAAGRVLQESMETSAQYWAVASMMPTLSMRQTMVHGYVPCGGA